MSIKKSTIKHITLDTGRILFRTSKGEWQDTEGRFWKIQGSIAQLSEISQ